MRHTANIFNTQCIAYRALRAFADCVCVLRIGTANTQYAYAIRKYGHRRTALRERNTQYAYAIRITLSLSQAEYTTHICTTHTQCTVHTLGHGSFVHRRYANTQYANWVTAFRSIHKCAFQYTNFNTLCKLYLHALNQRAV